jgi:hypothetical protein
MTKTIEHSFIDWEATAFGFGYGTGEFYILAALKKFMETTERRDDCIFLYDYKELETVLGPTVAWLMINALCRVDVLEYGSSPRFGWLTQAGEKLKAFVDSKSAQVLADLCSERAEDYIVCYPDACNCGPKGYEQGRVCQNPFWQRH